MHLHDLVNAICIKMTFKYQLALVGTLWTGVGCPGFAMQCKQQDPCLPEAPVSVFPPDAPATSMQAPPRPRIRMRCDDVCVSHVLPVLPQPPTLKRQPSVPQVTAGVVGIAIARPSTMQLMQLHYACSRLQAAPGLRSWSHVAQPAIITSQAAVPILTCTRKHTHAHHNISPPCTCIHLPPQPTLPPAHPTPQKALPRDASDADPLRAHQGLMRARAGRLNLRARRL